jgi:hypothetical protein
MPARFKATKLASPHAAAVPGRRARLHEQRPQVLVAALGDLAQDRAIPGRLLLGHEPGAKVASLLEGGAIADRRHHGTRDIGPTPGMVISLGAGRRCCCSV